MLNRRGDISVTVFVIMTIALFVTAIISFSLLSISTYKNISEGYKAVGEFNEKSDSSAFLNAGEKVDIVKTHKQYLGLFGDDVLDVEVNALPQVQGAPAAQ